MWRALIIGDIHYRAINPVARTDNYQEAIDAKLRECWALARKHNVDAILQTGDVFDSPGIVYTTLAEFMRLLEAAPAPIYTIPGEHDLFGHHPGSLYRTPLGFLLELGILRDATSGEKWSSNAGHHCVMLTGRGVDAQRDEDGHPYRLTERERIVGDILGPVDVRITHGMLVKQPFPAKHTLIADLDKYPDLPDVIVNGHFHTQTGIWRVGRTLVVTPGALCRKTAALEEMERQVQVALLTIDSTNVDAELIPLRSAAPGDQVLSREHLVAEAERAERRERFLELLAGEQSEKVLDLVDMVQDIAGREKLPRDVRDEALRRISLAQEAMTS